MRIRRDLVEGLSSCSGLSWHWLFPRLRMKNSQVTVANFSINSGIYSCPVASPIHHKIGHFFRYLSVPIAEIKETNMSNSS